MKFVLGSRRLRALLVAPALGLLAAACAPSPTPPPIVRVYSSVLNYGPTGWGGWSCPPATRLIVDAKALDATAGGDPSLMPPASPDMAQIVLWKPGATTTGSPTYTYPTTPFGYTYGTGEEGAIAQNINVGRKIVLALDCVDP